MTAAELKYLLAINELCDGTTGIKLTAIAAKMDVTKVSVHRAVEFWIKTDIQSEMKRTK